MNEEGARTMYNPRWFREDRLPVLMDAIDAVSFGTLVTTTDAGLWASHVPMILERSQGRNGTIYGHIARANLQWRNSVGGAEALAIFLGPSAYISPSWYKSKEETGKVVPTWNYITVHVWGSTNFFDDIERLRGLVTKLTAKFEAESESPWKPYDAPPDFVDQQLKAIVGFEMPIGRIEGKWKLGQNRSDADRTGAIAGLEKRGGRDNSEVAQEMKKVGSERVRTYPRDKELNGADR